MGRERSCSKAGVAGGLLLGWSRCCFAAAVAATAATAAVAAFELEAFVVFVGVSIGVGRKVGVCVGTGYGFRRCVYVKTNTKKEREPPPKTHYVQMISG